MRASVGPILPPTPSTDEIARRVLEMRREGRIRRAHEIFQRCNVGETLGQHGVNHPVNYNRGP
jgi:hypothetical protein